MSGFDIMLGSQQFAANQRNLGFQQEQQSYQNATQFNQQQGAFALQQQQMQADLRMQAFQMERQMQAQKIQEMLATDELERSRQQSLMMAEQTEAMRIQNQIQGFELERMQKTGRTGKVAALEEEYRLSGQRDFNQNPLMAFANGMAQDDRGVWVYVGEERARQAKEEWLATNPEMAQTLTARGAPDWARMQGAETNRLRFQYDMLQDELKQYLDFEGKLRTDLTDDEKQRAEKLLQQTQQFRDQAMQAGIRGPGAGTPQGGTTGQRAEVPGIVSGSDPSPMFQRMVDDLLNIPEGSGQVTMREKLQRNLQSLGVPLDDKAMKVFYQMVEAKLMQLQAADPLNFPARFQEALPELMVYAIDHIGTDPDWGVFFRQKR